MRVLTDGRGRKENFSEKKIRDRPAAQFQLPPSPPPPLPSTPPPLTFSAARSFCRARCVFSPLGTAADWLAACSCLWSAVVVEDEGSEGDAAVSLLFLSLCCGGGCIRVPRTTLTPLFCLAPARNTMTPPSRDVTRVACSTPASAEREGRRCFTSARRRKKTALEGENRDGRFAFFFPPSEGPAKALPR